MANLNETSNFPEGIFRIETDTIWLGGEGGPANLQGQQLANRTRYLKDRIDALNITDFCRTLLDDVDAAAARATLGAVSMAQLEAAIAALVDSSPGALDTLNELAAALGDDANFSATVFAALGQRLTISDFQQAAAITAVAGGTADAITAVFAPAITTGTAGRIPTDTLMIVAATANTGAGLTIDVGTGAFGVVKGAGAAIVSGDVAGAGHILHIRGVRGTHAAADKWVLLNPATGISSQAVPAGTIIHIAQASAPAGYLKANGAAVSRANYAALFAAIGTTFGIGDGVVDFQCPRFARRGLSVAWMTVAASMPAGYWDRRRAKTSNRTCTRLRPFPAATGMVPTPTTKASARAVGPAKHLLRVAQKRGRATSPCSRASNTEGGCSHG